MPIIDDLERIEEDFESIAEYAKGKDLNPYLVKLYKSIF